MANFQQSISAVSTTTSAKTVQSITAGAQNPVSIQRIEVGFDGTSATGPQVLVEFIKDIPSAGGTSTASNPTPASQTVAPTLAATGRKDYSVEPTYSGTARTVFSMYVHPQGKYIWVPPNDEAGRLDKSEGLFIRCTVGTAVNFSGNIYGSE